MCVVQLSEVTADLMEENTTSNQASEMLEAESAERMRLEKELKELQVSVVGYFGLLWTLLSVKCSLLLLRKSCIAIVLDYVYVCEGCGGRGEGWKICADGFCVCVWEGEGIAIVLKDIVCEREGIAIVLMDFVCVFGRGEGIAIVLMDIVCVWEGESIAIVLKDFVCVGGGRGWRES